MMWVGLVIVALLVAATLAAMQEEEMHPRVGVILLAALAVAMLLLAVVAEVIPAAGLEVAMRPASQAAATARAITRTATSRIPDAARGTRNRMELCVRAA